MAPLKFEEHIKDQMEQRKLQPSADAWQKLNEQLDDESEKKNNKAFWWFGIAASIIGVLLVVTVMLNSGNENTIPTIVDTENTDTIIKNEVLKEAVTDVKQEQDTNKAPDKILRHPRLPSFQIIQSRPGQPLKPQNLGFLEGHRKS